jgi:hypothetical protein
LGLPLPPSLELLLVAALPWSHLVASLAAAFDLVESPGMLPRQQQFQCSSDSIL